ncbi:hypothetical protein [Levilactobacillus namurensis]|uniref:Uncharacterized protein n=1 Tax=Levilactobacillus namurensis TaxID=380393 RepID=A0AAW8W8B1_9LACO|nr:hypothetical protein [Levilactobacillus namurensis]MDT7014977.1 hypothetical protein [Levilactobacillus namurensis]
MLENKLSDEKRQFEMLTWRAQKHGAQVVAEEQMRKFTVTIEEQEAILVAAQSRRATVVS